MKFAFLSIGTVLLGLALVWAADAPPPVQPLAFSHKLHAGSLALECKTCHQNPEPGHLMTFPAEKICMSCHVAVKTESAEIQKLAAWAREQKTVPWVRVYKVPSYVFWSHESHLRSGATCEKCHGPVSTRESMRREVDHSMAACIACHRQEKASVDCAYCHEQRN